MNRKRFLEAELDNLCNKKAKGAQIRSRYKWVTDGEKNTKYFLGLEAKQQSSNVIREIKSDGNDSITSQSDIMGEMCSFYEKLYTSKNISDTDIDNYLSNTEIPKLSSNDKEYCDEFPTIEECREAVFNMKANKSPGLDGLPSEFYKCMWVIIANLFYDALKEIYVRKEMSFSQRLSVISLLHKKGDKTLLKNYRPLSLSNIDYKIIAFCFARRLKHILEKLISNEQSAYVKGRYIGENARIILDIFEYCDNYENDGVLLFLDFEKAFDSVEWNFLFKTLTEFNFGNNFIEWMKILYTSPMFQLKNNGWVSKTCYMTRGIRQGCPISAILYLFVAEILAIKIRTNDQIEGFKFNNIQKEIKSVQHADDLTLALKNIVSVEHAVETIDVFCRHAGSKININKTEYILMGHLAGTYDNIQGINVNTNVVKCLGIYIGHNKEECYIKNWMDVYHGIEKLFESWKKRKLTILGKCCIVNSLALSKLLYVASLLPMPNEEYIKKINKLIYTFIWNSRDRIRRNVLISPIEYGGIGIVDVETKLKALKASWVSRIINTDSNIHKIVNSFLHVFDVDIDYILQTSETKLKDFDLVKNLPSFYQEVFTFFNACKRNLEYSQIHSDAFMQQTIWNNKYVCYKGKTLFFRNWIKSGFKYICNLYDENGAFKSIDCIMPFVQKKNNILCEYMILKTVFAKLSKHFNFSNAIHVNPRKTYTFLFHDGMKLISDQKCKLFYNSLLENKEQIPSFQSILANTFDIHEHIHWKKNYCNKIKHISDPNIAEFNYKLLHNILNNNYLVSKWKPNFDMNCRFCHAQIENTKHLIYECDNEQNIWFVLGDIYGFRIQWKHVVVGFYLEDNMKIRLLNFIISFIACKIYKYKMYCRLEDIDETVISIHNYIKHHVVFMGNLFKYSKNTHGQKLFEKLSLLL